MDEQFRKKLQHLGNKKRFRFSGKFIKYGFKYTDYRKTHAVPTILLGDIKLIQNDILLTDHLWFNLTKGFKHIGILRINDLVSFNGRIATYTKGYQGWNTDIKKPIKTDYDIERPTKIKLETVISATATRSFWIDEDWKICNQIYDTYSESYESRNIFKPYPEY